MLEKLHEKCNRTAELCIYYCNAFVAICVYMVCVFSSFKHIILAAFYFHVRNSECGRKVMVYTKTHFVIGFVGYTSIAMCRNCRRLTKPNANLVCHTLCNIVMCSFTQKALLSLCRCFRLRGFARIKRTSCTMAYGLLIFIFQQQRRQKL